MKGGLGESMFGRLVSEGKLKPFMLNSQYRMHPESSRDDFPF
jgi:hypothetical protein